MVHIQKKKNLKKMFQKMLMEHRLRTRHMGLRECPRLYCGSLVASWDAQRRTTRERRVKMRGGAKELDHSRRQAEAPKNQHLFLMIPFFFSGVGRAVPELSSLQLPAVQT